MEFEGGDSAGDPLTGPVVAAGLGASLRGRDVRLLAAIPGDATSCDREFIRQVDPEGQFLSPVAERPLRWAGKRIVAETGAWEIQGDARRWRAPLPPEARSGMPLVLANGDPAWYAELLTSARPSFVAIDVEAAWAPYRGEALNTCLTRANLITVTATDLRLMPKRVWRDVRAGHRGAPAALLIKHGREGISVLADGRKRDLPPPTAPDRVVTDVGAGDLLLGALSACLSREAGPLSLDAVEGAYRGAIPILAELLHEGDFADFARRRCDDDVM
jgi:hypothetical protein